MVDQTAAGSPASLKNAATVPPPMPMGFAFSPVTLFIALARAVGIPAREVRGLVYLGDDIQGFGGHVWSEVSIGNSWVAVDPTWDLQVLSATHIQLEAENDNNIYNGMHKDSNQSFSLIAAKYR